MAFKISKSDRTRIDLIVAKLETKKSDLGIVVSEYNEAVNEARGKVDDAIAELNEVRDELRGVIEDIHSEMEGEYDERSENWRDGDRGQATYSWLEALTETKEIIEIEITIDPFEELEIDVSELEGAIENIPSEPEY